MPGTQDIPHAAVTRAIDRTLNQLWSLLRSGSVETWLQNRPPGPALTWLSKECGLKALLDYFGSGQRALQLIVHQVELVHPGLSDARRDEYALQLQLAFTILVQIELDVLCGDCIRNGRCTLSGRRPAALPSKPAAPVKAKRSARRKS